MDDNEAPPTGAVEQLRIEVPGPGAYAVDAETLSKAGWTPDTALALSQDGVPLPILRRDAQLVFSVPARTALYDTTQVLWLAPTDAGAAPPAHPAPASTAGAEQAIGIAALEEEHLYNPKAPNDPWFWKQMVAPNDHTFPLNLPGRAEGDLTIQAVVWGVTGGQHAVRLDVAGQQSEVITWEGSTERMTLTFEVPAPPLGELTLTLHQPPAEQGVDIVLLDHLEVHYPRALQTEDDQLDFKVDQDGAVRVSGLSGHPLVWQTDAAGHPVLTNILWQDGGATFSVQAGQHYSVRGPKAWQKPSVKPVQNTQALRQQPIAADYIAIVAPALQQSITPLLDHRRAQGFQVAAITPQEIYDAFGTGNRDPEAIRAFLRHAMETSNPAPRYVLLVGDTSYDLAGRLSEKPLDPAAIIPSPFVNTIFGGWTVSDNKLADLDDDMYPDVALGRIPASTPAQAQDYVQKLLAYEQQPVAGDWQRRVLLTADGQQAEFQATSELLKDHFPAELSVETFYPTANQDATQQLQTLFDSGALLVNYVGHGSVDQWGKDKLLTSEVAEQLQNGPRLPFVINMTCLTGLFSNPSQLSLAEVLLFNPNGGAIAVLAPTSLTLPSEQNQLNAALVDGLVAEGSSFGEALNKAKRILKPGSHNSHDVIATFNLLGDPALKMVTAPAQAIAP